MQRRDNFAHLILASVVALVLGQLMVYVDAHAQIVFTSRRDGNREIYVMDTDGKNQQRLTNNPQLEGHPAWFGPTFAVTPAGKTLTMWGWLKQVSQ